MMYVKKADAPHGPVWEAGWRTRLWRRTHVWEFAEGSLPQLETTAHCGMG